LRCSRVRHRDFANGRSYAAAGRRQARVGIICSQALERRRFGAPEPVCRRRRRDCKGTGCRCECRGSQARDGNGLRGDCGRSRRGCGPNFALAPSRHAGKGYIAF
jgi:hypothetical protein